MATYAYPATSEMQTLANSPEQALCDLFDIVEDALENKSPAERKAWLDGLSEQTGSSGKRP